LAFNAGCFTSRERTLAPIDWEGGRLGGPERQSGYFRKEKISWPLPRFEPWIIQLELSIDNV